MVTPETLCGYWHDPPGGHLIVRLAIDKDGHGAFTFVTPSETSKCKFSWHLSDSGEHITFSLIGPPAREFLSFDVPWQVTFTPRVHRFGFVRDMLTFKRWHESQIVETGGGEKLEIPAQWMTADFYRG